MKRYFGSLAASLSLLIAAVGGAALLTGGCGSSSSTIATAGSAVPLATRSATGGATVQIQWPSRTAAHSRLIPVASNTLLFQITFQGKIILTQTVGRPAGTNPTSVLNLPSLPVGQLGVSIYAIPDTTVAVPTAVPTDAQATGKGTLNIAANKTSTIHVTLNSTIKSLVIVPTPASLPDYLAKGATQTFDVEALDASGAIVVISPQTIVWQTGNESVMTVTPHTTDTGVDISGVNSGDTSLTVVETETSQVATLPVAVRGPLAALRITTILPSVNVQGIVQFGYVGTDAGGYVIPGVNIPGLQWTSSNIMIASIDRTTGACTAISTGSAQGTISGTCFITLTAGTFKDTQILTVNAGMASSTQCSPVTVILAPSTSQVFSAQTQSPTAGLSVPTTTFSIVVPTGGTPGQFGVISQTATQKSQGYCIYTTPAVKPMVTNNGVTSTVSAIAIQASNGAQSVVTLQ